MLKKSLAVLLFLLPLGLGACATGEKVLPPTPPEIKLIVNQAFLATLRSRETDVNKALKVRDIFVGIRAPLLFTLQEELPDLEHVSGNYLQGLNSEYAELANTVLQIAIFRLRPLIDQGKTELAAQYIEAVIDGSINAIDLYVGGKAEANSLALKDMGIIYFTDLNIV